MLGLPDHVTACLFDLDGVLTDTASIHEAAWKQTFDEFLRGRGGQAPFTQDDYNAYVDGRPRVDGVRTFLAARHLDIPDGEPRDAPDAATVNGIANRKNALVLAQIKAGGVRVYPGSVAYLRATKAAGLRRAVVSASANCHEVLVAAGIEDLLEERIDGVVAVQRHLRGKPEPDTFLAGAAALGTAPAESAVFEDAVAGVQAGRSGGFGFVVGVDRVGHRAALLTGGATVVVADLADLLEAS